jgi:hypothetical protein
MHLFTRTGVLGGHPDRAMAWAVKVGGQVSEASGREFATWTAHFGQPVGTYVWSTWFEGHADLPGAFGALSAHPGFQAAVEEGGEFQAGAHETAFRQVVVGGPGEGAEGPGLGALAVVTTAVAAGGKLVEAIGWGSDVANLITSITGLPVTFLVDAYGAFGQVTWIGGAPDMAAVDASNDATNANAEYLQMLSQIGELFVPGSGQRALYQRIG